MRLIGLKKKSSPDDLTLIRHYRDSGDKNAVGVLFERYAAIVFGVCMKYLKNEDDCKDAVLQIFEKLLTDLKKYDITRFSSWLHSVAKNYCFMHLRNREALERRMHDFTADTTVMDSGDFYYPEEKQVDEQ